MAIVSGRLNKVKIFVSSYVESRDLEKCHIPFHNHQDFINESGISELLPFIFKLVFSSRQNPFLEVDNKDL